MDAILIYDGNVSGKNGYHDDQWAGGGGVGEKVSHCYDKGIGKYLKKKTRRCRGSVNMFQKKYTLTMKATAMSQ